MSHKPLRSGGVGRRFVLACATVIEELLPLLPPEVGHRTLDFGLHSEPSRLRAALQAAIDGLQDSCDIVILGYGLCSQGVVGLEPGRCSLVVPRVDDCISIFLGSRSAHREQASREPGTYYLTKGWIEAGDGPFAEYDRVEASYGRPMADRVMARLLGNYTRLALIDTGQYGMERYRAHARTQAERAGLRFEELEGSDRLVRKMLEGPWDDEFVVVAPGGKLRFEDFFPAGPALAATAATAAGTEPAQ